VRPLPRCVYHTLVCTCTYARGAKKEEASELGAPNKQEGGGFTQHTGCHKKGEAGHRSSAQQRRKVFQDLS
jgi:hypothetical protein